MPLNDYVCPQCGKEIKDVLVKTTKTEYVCPSCGCEMDKLPPKSNWQWGRR